MREGPSRRRATRQMSQEVLRAIKGSPDGSQLKGMRRPLAPITALRESETCAADRHAVHPQGGLAHANGNALPAFATGSNPLVKGKVIAD